MARGVMPPPAFALKGHNPEPGVTNVRDVRVAKALFPLGEDVVLISINWVQ